MMENMYKFTAIGLVVAVMSGCGSDGTSTNAGGMDASSCVTRTLKTIYTNDCEFAVNAILFEPGASPFKINENSAKTQAASGNSFGACRFPSVPVLNSDSSNFSCS